MLDSFASARLKIERSKKHIAEIELLVSDLPNSYIRAVENLTYPENLQQVTYTSANIDGLLAELGVVIGDAVHNLYSAIDHAYVGSIMQHASTAKTKRTKFPIYQTKRDLECALKGIKIHELSPALYHRIVTDIKPYRTGDDRSSMLVYLCDLDATDKHELLIPTLVSATIKGLSLINELGETSRGDTVPIRGNGPISFFIRGNSKIENHGDFTLFVSLQDIDALQSIKVVSLLNDFSKIALYIVQLLESI